jgi:hypothetical protein
MGNWFVLFAGCVGIAIGLYAMPTSILQAVVCAAIGALALLLWIGAQRPPASEALTLIEFAEWRCALGFTLSCAAIATYLLGSTYVRRSGLAINEAAQLLVSQALVYAMAAWLTDCVAQRVWQRRNASLEADERDRTIAAQSVLWGYSAFALCVIGVAFSLARGESTSSFVTTLSIANVLGFSFLWGIVIRYAVAGVFYWLDRRAQAFTA